jgi:hypothetical protein
MRYHEKNSATCILLIHCIRLAKISATFGGYSAKWPKSGQGGRE